MICHIGKISFREKQKNRMRQNTNFLQLSSQGKTNFSPLTITPTLSYKLERKTNKI